MDKPTLYIVKSIVSNEYIDEFNEWYHKKHIPKVIEHSGCKTARRFKVIEPEDKFLFMAVYEFPNIKSHMKYQNSQAKQELLLDFKQNFGDRAAEFKRELRRSAWEQIYP